MTWARMIDANAATIDANRGPSLAVIVSGSETDASFWQQRAGLLTPDLFRRDGNVRVTAVVERRPRGNFLGTLEAWTGIRSGADRSSSGLMTMVFGEGRRFSPFTQTLGNRKPAFPTPAFSSRNGVYLNAAELAMRHTAGWIDAMNRGGFRGLLVKWGDEALVPEAPWSADALHEFDAIRFVSIAEPDEVSAREKEWLVIDRTTREVVAELPRQDPATLLERIREFRASGYEVGVNLGSLAASYELLDAAAEALESAFSPNDRLDWDPFVWLALLCKSEEEWKRQSNLTGSAGDALRRTLQQVPELYGITKGIRERLQARTGRPLRVAAWNFTNSLWIDFGLHGAARRALLRLVEGGAEAAVARRLFSIGDEPDERGNVILRSRIAPGVDIVNSVILDSVIDAGTIAGGVIVGSRIGSAAMPHRGAILFCDADDLRTTGENAIAFSWRGGRLSLAEGERVSMVRAGERLVELRSSEATVYDEMTFSTPIFGNEISFAEAADLARRFGAVYRDDISERG